MAIRDLFSKKQVCHFLVTDEGEIAKKYNHFMEFLANNLAVWFGINVLFPAGRDIDWFALGVAIISFIARQKFKLDTIPLVAGAAALGLIYRRLF